MSPLSNWFRPASDGSEERDTHTDREREAERDQLEDTLAWTSLIMNDDMDGAWKGLQAGDSSFHSLGAAVTLFMRAVLGFEKHFMAETAAKLADGRRAQRRAGRGPRLYPPGTEYELVRAETQLVTAVVGVMHESLVEAMRNFLKLRKAFVMLDAIVAHEAKAGRGGAAPASSEAGAADAGSSSSDDVADDGRPALSTTATTPEPEPRAPPDDDGDEALGLDDPLDVFVHSGANMCLGIILLILSLVPPALSRVLGVVGFGGARQHQWGAGGHGPAGLLQRPPQNRRHRARRGRLRRRGCWRTCAPATRTRSCGASRRRGCWPTRARWGGPSRY